MSVRAVTGVVPDATQSDRAQACKPPARPPSAQTPAAKPLADDRHALDGEDERKDRGDALAAVAPDFPHSAAGCDGVPVEYDACDVAVFASEVSPTSASAQQLAQLAGALGEWLDERLDESRATSPMQCAFDIDVPGLGRLTGRMSIATEKAELELSASRPATATALRARLSQLQQLVHRESGGDVDLFIV